MIVWGISKVIIIMTTIIKYKQLYSTRRNGGPI